MKSDNTEQELANKIFIQREYEQNHLPYERELSFLDAVKKGDILKVKELMMPLQSDKLGLLSDDPVRNLKYHLIITIALITRFCIEGGLERETAYTLSDLYIQKIDKSKSEEEVETLHKKVIFDFTKKMQHHNQDNVMSKPVVKTLDYIHNHLHESIQIYDLADFVGLTSSYLCTLFKKEMNISIASFIRIKRVEAAQNLLKFSDYTSVDIGNYLAFNSHSHFISVFKKETGMTPKVYRNKYFSSNWRSVK